MSVTTWRARFLAHRLNGLVDLPRSGAPQAVTDTAIDLEDAIHAYIAQTNTDPKPFVWTKPADAILANVGRSARELLTQTTRITQTTRSTYIACQFILVVTLIFETTTQAELQHVWISDLESQTALSNKSLR
jgi:hypothetical protein